jgi:hypothetical protein
MSSAFFIKEKPLILRDFAFTLSSITVHFSRYLQIDPPLTVENIFK